MATQTTYPVTVDVSNGTITFNGDSNLLIPIDYSTICTITWTPATGVVIDTFDLSSPFPAPSGMVWPFVVTSFTDGSGSLCYQAQDTNTQTGNCGDFGYSMIVTKDGIQYGQDPTIENRRQD